METKKYYKAKADTMICGYKCESIHVKNKSHPRKADTEQHYDIAVYIKSDRLTGWADLGHVSESKLKSMIEE